MAYANNLPVIVATRGTCSLCQRGNLVLLRHGSGVAVVTMHTVQGQQCSGSYSTPENTYAVAKNAALWCGSVRQQVQAAQRQLCRAVAHSHPATSRMPMYAPNLTTKACCCGQCPQCTEATHGKAAQ